MSTSTVNIGDIVKLISGGPDMVVSRVNKHVLKCVWYNTVTGAFQEAIVAKDLLVKSASPASPPAL